MELQSKEYARIRTAYEADAWLYGTTTTKEFTKSSVPDGFTLKNVEQLKDSGVRLTYLVSK